MNIVIQELKKRKILIIVWILIWGSMQFFTLSLYGSISEKMDEIVELYKVFPKEIFEMFGSSIDSLATIQGFLNADYIMMYTLATGIMILNISANSFSKEIENKSILFLLTKPVSRKQIYFSKVFSNILVSIFINTIIFLLTYIGIALFISDISIPTNYILSIWVVSVIYNILCINIGSLLGIVVNRGKAVSIGVLFILISFLLDTISIYDSFPSILKIFSVFYYVNLGYIADNSEVLVPEIFYLLILSIIIFFIGRYIFNKKNFDI